MSVMEKWSSYHSIVRRLSVLFGFILIFGLSENGYIVSFIVALSLLTLTSAEARILRKIKELENISQWSGALWVLLTCCIAYMATDRLSIRIGLLCLVVLSHYIYLYTICYSEKLTLSYIKKLIWDIPILVMAFPIDLFERENNPEKKIKGHSCLVGICILLVLLMCVFLPFYIMSDIRMYSILAALISSVSSGVPVLGIYAFLGIMPAMANYSLIKGIGLDIVLGNRERQNKENIIGKNYFLNVVTVKIIIAGLMIVNAVFLA